MICAKSIKHFLAIAQINITRKGLAILNNPKSYQLVTRALLTGDEAVGALVGVRGALPVLL